MKSPSLPAVDTQTPLLGSRLPFRPRPRLWRRMPMPRIALSALKPSPGVGSALNLIHNGERWWTQHRVNLGQVTLNLGLPLCVSTCSTARNETQRVQGG